MGLDNGIIARKTNIIKIDNDLSRLSSYAYSDGDFEIAYWRKCYNVRRSICRALDGINDNGSTFISREELLTIIKELKKFNRKNWSIGGWEGSIWDWSEIKKSHRTSICRLRRLARLMKKYPNIEVYFYDSY